MTKRSSVVSRILKKFRRASVLEARGLVTSGFELETQRSSGLTWRGYKSFAPLEFDRERYNQDVNRTFKYRTENPMYFWRMLTSKVPDMTPSNYATKLDALGVWSVRDAARKGLVTRAEARKMLAKIRAQTLTEYSEAAYRSPEKPTTYMRREHSLPDTLEAGHDASVRGFEFRTIGGLTFDQFKEASTSVYRIEHKIDKKCSFHIHLAIPGIKHSYGEKFQAAMIEYLAENIKRVPRTVRTRWKTVRRNQYIRGLIDNGNKYNFINKHEQLNTWEFRCFGNVKNHRDAMKCLDLAIEAMQHGYKVLADEANAVYPFITHDAWSDMVYRSLETGTPFSQTLEETTSLRVA